MFTCFHPGTPGANFWMRWLLWISEVYTLSSGPTAIPITLLKRPAWVPLAPPMVVR